MKKLRIVQGLMSATILLIVAFQAYYVINIYKSEFKDLKKETDVLFRETVYKLQVSRFKNDTAFVRKFATDDVFNVQAINVLKNKNKRSIVKTEKKDSAKARLSFSGRTIMMAMSTDSFNRKIINDDLRARVESLATKPPVRFRIITSNNADNVSLDNRRRTSVDSVYFRDTILKRQQFKANFERDNFPVRKMEIRHAEKKPTNNIDRSFISENKTPVDILRTKPDAFEDGEIQIFSNNKSLNDSLPLVQLDSAYKKELKKSSIQLPFTLIKSTGNKSALQPLPHEFKTNPASVGFLTPYHYQASFKNPFSFLLNKIAPNILLSLLLVAFTIISFVVLYRNLMSQRRLADIKNEFISNITHELKTPIATVNVAIEAMKNFNVLNDTKRTQEYLDISASELQRLSLLVDKVLKLSMFEKKEIELKKEWFNMEELVREVMNSMRLQFDKQNAKISINVTGDKQDIKADRLHITSVVYNLFDNALKYSKGECQVDVNIISNTNHLELQVTDNGIGIGSEFKTKIFEQFFRVPSGDRHNIKGYGLGLSYVNHIVKSHHGFIEVESEFGKGSTFSIKLPYDEKDVIQFDKNRSIRKEFYF